MGKNKKQKGKSDMGFVKSSDISNLKLENQRLKDEVENLKSGYAYSEEYNALLQVNIDLKEHIINQRHRILELEKSLKDLTNQ